MDERDSGEGEQLVGAADVLEVADAGGGGDVADPFDRGGGERAACALGGDPAVQPFGLGEDPAEVVGGEPGDELAVPDGRGEAAADLGQHPVAGEAAVLGVDPLEAVDVDEDEREGALVPLRASRLGAQLLVEGAVVGQVRQLSPASRARPAGRSRRRTRSAGCAASASSSSRDGSLALGDDAPQSGRRRGSAAAPVAGLAGREDCAAGVVARRAGRSCRGRASPKPRGSAGADDRAEAAGLEADDGGRVDTQVDGAISSATMEKSSTGSGSSATASWIRCSAVRAVKRPGHGGSATMPATKPSSSRRASRRPSSTT